MLSIRMIGSIVILLLLGTACGSDSPSGPTEDTGSDASLQMPLQIGNRWVYQVVETAGAGLAADTTTVSSTLIGNRNIDGAEYFTEVDSSRFGADTSYVRQVGNEVLTYLDLGTSSDPVFETVLDLLAGTMPWKLAEFGAPVGTDWTSGSVDTTLVLEGSAWNIVLAIQGTSRGTGAVAVPAGTWAEAQHFRFLIEVTAEIVGTGIGGSQTSDQDLWFVDGVGVVKETSLDSFDSPQGSVEFRTTGELLSYTFP